MSFWTLFCYFACINDKNDWKNKERKGEEVATALRKLL